MSFELDNVKAEVASVPVLFLRPEIAVCKPLLRGLQAASSVIRPKFFHV